jgi:predicted phage gp36 major capsid-like protein
VAGTSPATLPIAIIFVQVYPFSSKKPFPRKAGNGVKKPRGFLTRNIVATADATRTWGDLQYVASGDANVVMADALRSLVWGLRAPYRAGS